MQIQILFDQIPKMINQIQILIQQAHLSFVVIRAINKVDVSGTSNLQETVHQGGDIWTHVIIILQWGTDYVMTIGEQAIQEGQLFILHIKTIEYHSW